MRGPIPEGMWGYDATAMQYNHDETKAKAEWDKVTQQTHQPDVSLLR